MFSDRKHFLCDAELPVAAVAVRSQGDLAAMFHQCFDRRHFVLDVSVGVDAKTPGQFQSVRLGILFSPYHIFFRRAGVVDQQDGLLFVEMRQHGAQAGFPGDREGRRFDAEDLEQTQVFALSGLIEMVLGRVFLVVHGDQFSGGGLIDQFEAARGDGVGSMWNDRGAVGRTGRGTQLFGNRFEMRHRCVGFLIGKAEYFGKILPADLTEALGGSGIGGVADVTHGHDAILEHLLLGELDPFLYDARIEAAFGDHGAEKFDESGMRGNDIFKMTQLEVAMGVDESGHQDTLERFDALAGFGGGHYVYDAALLIGDQYLSPGQFIPIE